MHHLTGFDRGVLPMFYQNRSRCSTNSQILNSAKANLRLRFAPIRWKEVCVLKFTAMMKVYARAIFDRKRQLETKGLGQVEILVTFNRYEKKYISVKKCTASEWQRYQYSVELEQELSVYNSIAAKMEV